MFRQTNDSPAGYVSPDTAGRINRAFMFQTPKSKLWEMPLRWGPRKSTARARAHARTRAHIYTRAHRMRTSFSARYLHTHAHTRAHAPTRARAHTHAHKQSASTRTIGLSLSKPTAALTKARNLRHKARDYAVELAALEVQWLALRAHALFACTPPSEEARGSGIRSATQVHTRKHCTPVYRRAHDETLLVRAHARTRARTMAHPCTMRGSWPRFWARCRETARSRSCPP